MFEALEAWGPPFALDGPNAAPYGPMMGLSTGPPWAQAWAPSGPMSGPMMGSYGPMMGPRWAPDGPIVLILQSLPGSGSEHEFG